MWNRSGNDLTGSLWLELRCVCEKWWEMRLERGQTARGARWHCWDFLLVIIVGPLKKYEAGEWHVVICVLDICSAEWTERASRSAGRQPTRRWMQASVLVWRAAMIALCFNFDFFDYHWGWTVFSWADHLHFPLLCICVPCPFNYWGLSIFLIHLYELFIIKEINLLHIYWNTFLIYLPFNFICRYVSVMRLNI